MALFVDHVATLGHRCLLVVDGPQEVDTVHRRVTAVRRHARARGIAVTVRHAPATEEGGFDVVRMLLRAGQFPTACGVGSLNQLFGVLAALREGGVSVPDEASVVSFDEDQCLGFLDVPVTSVCMPLAQLGGAAVDALIARIEGTDAGQPAHRDVMVGEPMFLVPRASVAAPPATTKGTR
jgi:LacI family transcriptional regulator